MFLEDTLDFRTGVIVLDVQLLPVPIFVVLDLVSSIAILGRVDLLNHQITAVVPATRGLGPLGRPDGIHIRWIGVITNVNPGAVARQLSILGLDGP